MAPVAPLKEEEERQIGSAALTRLMPRSHVVLLDDEEHTYEYVVEMLMALFGHVRERAWNMAREVDRRGRAKVFTSNGEQAEHKRSQIQSYGADWRLDQSKGSMSAIVEQAD